MVYVSCMFVAHPSFTGNERLVLYTYMITDVLVLVVESCAI